MFVDAILLALWCVIVSGCFDLSFLNYKTVFLYLSSFTNATNHYLGECLSPGSSLQSCEPFKYAVSKLD